MSPCTDYGSVIVCTTGSHLRRAVGCSFCEIADAPLVRSIPSSPYYGDDFTCTVCGDSWSEGYLSERPFRRGWRQKSIARAVAKWEAACECKPAWDDDAYFIPCEHEVSA